jgi:hypothetical protein
MLSFFLSIYQIVVLLNVVAPLISASTKEHFLKGMALYR